MRKAFSAFASTLTVVQALWPSALSALVVPSPVELVFVAFATPCRIFDTHATTPLANATDRNAFINLAGYNYPSQGGASGGCGVPASALAVAISVTTSGGSSNGFVTITPGGNPASTYQASFLPNSPETAGMTIGLRANRITLHPIGGSVQVYIDINGYYAPQIEAFISTDGTTYSQTGRVLSSAKVSTGHYRIFFDRDVSSCAGFSSATSGSYITNIVTNVNYADVLTFNFANGAFVAADHEFNIGVHC